MVVKKKSLVFAIIFLSLLIPLSSAVLEVEKSAKAEVVIPELNNPAIFELNIKNVGQPDTFEIFSLVGVTMDPRGAFELNTGDNPLEVKAYLSEDIRNNIRGFFKFEYQIKGTNSGLFKDMLTVNLVPLAETVEISVDDIRPGDSEAVINVANRQNAQIDGLKLSFNSAFFSYEGNVSLTPYGVSKIRAKLDRTLVSKLSAGDYIMTDIIGMEDASVKAETPIVYISKEDVSETRTSVGFIIRDTKITKANRGNVPVSAEITLSRDILTRLVTTYSVEPTSSNRGGVFVDYSWSKDLLPGEYYSVTVTTNYTFPFVLIILIVLVVVLVRIFTQRSLMVTKRVSLVKTKGGEFALRVRLHVKARKGISNVQVIDRLPGMTKLYEKFGAKPDKIDPATRRLFWSISKLAAGEERVFSYIVYSKVSMVGSFELPATTAVYEEDGKTHEVLSNKTFFVANTGSATSE